MTDDQPEPEYNLVMPFVLCASNGGPYDDDAFVAGYTLGALDEELQALQLHCATPKQRYVRPVHLPQVDLIAMRHDYRAVIADEPDGDGVKHGRHLVTFEHTSHSADPT